jgi:EmrB/QacA subfamily drug resistance transporter
MENMDSTAIATSLPAIAADIGTSPIALKLALTAYLVSLAIFIPVSGYMADRFGAKRVFRASLGVFVLGSIACAASGSLLEFVFARFFQGMGGAMMTPIARLVLVRVTERRHLVNAVAWLTIPSVAGPLLGPPVGGFIATFLSWHWIFFVNVPIGLAGIWLAGRFLPEFAPGEPSRLDVAGFFMTGIAASGIVFGLSVVSLPAIPPLIGEVVLAAGVFALLLYIRHSRRVENPILDLSLFRLTVFREANLANCLFRIGAGASPFLLPLLFQLGFGLSPFQSGLLTFPSAAGAMLAKFVTGPALRHGGFRTILIATALLGGATLTLCMFFTPGTPIAIIVAILVMAGIVRSLFFTSCNALLFAEIGEKEASQATAISAALQQITIALGVALGGGVLEATAHLTGGDATSREAFATAFLVVGAVMTSSVIFCLRLPVDAGADLSGHAGKAGRKGKPD